jgi:hypothetical protein
MQPGCSLSTRGAAFVHARRVLTGAHATAREALGNNDIPGTSGLATRIDKEFGSHVEGCHQEPAHHLLRCSTVNSRRIRPDGEFRTTGPDWMSGMPLLPWGLARFCPLRIERGFRDAQVATIIRECEGRRVHRPTAHSLRPDDWCRPAASCSANMPQVLPRRSAVTRRGVAVQNSTVD